MTISPSQRNEEGRPGARKRPRLSSRPEKSRAAQSRGPITSTVATVGTAMKEENHGCRHAVVLIAGLCVLAYTLAVYALSFTLGVTAAQFAYHTGAGFVGFVAAFGVLVLLLDMLRSPILRLIVALVFAAPAAVAGYALVHGVTEEAVPSEIRQQIFCIIGGALVGISALLRLAGGMGQPTR